MSTLPPKSDDFFPKVMKKHISVMRACIGKKSTACFPDERPTKQKKGSGQKPEPLIILVRPARFERATLGLEDRCSIQLSYGCENNGRSNRI